MRTLVRQTDIKTETRKETKTDRQVGRHTKICNKVAQTSASNTI